MAKYFAERFTVPRVLAIALLPFLCLFGLEAHAGKWGLQGYFDYADPVSGASAAGSWVASCQSAGYVGCRVEYYKTNLAESGTEPHPLYAAYAYSGDGKPCAQGKSTTSGCNDPNRKPEKKCPASDKPISFATGYKRFHEVEFTGGKGSKLQFERFYTFSPGYYASPAPIDLWSFSYSQKLAAYATLNSDGSPTYRVKIFLPGGTTYWFSSSDQINYTSDDSTAPISLSFIPGATPALKKWLATYTDGTVETYSFLSGRLLSIKSPDGNLITIARDPNYSVATKTITEVSTGRQIVVNNDGAASFSVVAPDGAIFKYDLSSTQLKVTYPDDTPSNAADNHTVLYNHYTSSNSNDNRIGAVTSVVEDGVTTASYQYSPLGYAIQEDIGDQANPITTKINYLFDSSGQIYQAMVTNPNGKDTIYHLSKANDSTQLVTSIDGQPSEYCDSSSKSITYDQNNFKDKETDFNGNVTDHDFDALGREQRRTEGLDGAGNSTSESRVFETDYDPATNLVAETRLLGRVKNTYTYYSNKRLQSRTETDLTSINTPYYTAGGSRVWTYSYTYYDADQTKLKTMTVDGPRTDVSDITEYSYDAVGNLTQLKNGLNQAVNYSNFTSSGLPQTIVDENGISTSMQYYVRGWLKSSTRTTAEGSFTTGYTYYPNGLLKRITAPDGSWLEYSYDAAQYITSITNQNGESIVYTPNKEGVWKNETVQSSSGNIVRQRQRVFDELGRLKKVIGNSNQYTEYFYDNEANRTGVDQHRLSPETGGEETLHTGYGLDALNRVKTITDPMNRVITNAYDAQDHVISVTDPRQNTTSYVFNGFGEKIKETSPDAGVRYFAYDGAGNLTLEQDANGRLIHYSFDALNRITQELHDAESTLDVTYFYDEGVNGKGHLTSVIDASTRANNGSGKTVYEYDGRGNLIAVTTSLIGESFRTAYTYSSNNEISTITYPSGRVVEYVRASSGHITNVLTRDSANGANQIVVQDVDYLPFGPISSLSYGNGLMRTLSFDMDYRLNAILTGDTNASVQDLTFGYDWLNNITSITDFNQANKSQAFVYDQMQRLVDASGEYGRFIYGYDEVGNRTSVSKSMGGVSVFSETYAYPSGSNRLDSVTRTSGSATSSRALGYDNAGNIISDARSVTGLTRQYQFNASNRMSGVIDNGANKVGYVYNALGQRVLKTLSGQTPTVFQFGLNGELLAEKTGSSQLREYIYLEGQIVAANITPSIVASAGNQLSTGGSFQSFAPTAENPIGNFSFNAIAGQSYVLNLSNVTISGNTDISIYRPDGTLLSSFSVTSLNGDAVSAQFALNNLNQNGSYSVRITPSNGVQTGSLDLGMQLPNLIGNFISNGASIAFVPAQPGQSGRFTFDGVAGKNYSLLVTANVLFGNTVISVIRPDGRRLGYSTISNPSGNAEDSVMDLSDLPSTGTYTVFVAPESGMNGSLNLSLKQDQEANLPVDSSPMFLNLASGQNAAISLSLSSGQNLGLGISELSLLPAGNSVSASIYKPDGSFWLNCGVLSGSSSGGSCDLLNVPSSGIYTLVVDPAGASSASFVLTLSNEVNSSITVNAASYTSFASSRAGQNGRFTFTGATGGFYSLVFKDDTFLGATNVKVLSPAGVVLVDSSVTASVGTTGVAKFNLANMAMAGTYTVFISPEGASTGSLNVAIKQDVTGSANLNAGAVTVTIGSGQNATYTFSGTAGSYIGIGISNLILTPSDALGGLSYSVIKPDGTLLIDCGAIVGSNGGSCDVPILPVSGSYKIRLVPTSIYSASFKMSTRTDLRATLNVNSTNYTYSTTTSTFGQNARLDFNGVSGKAYTVKITNDTFVGTTPITVYKPDGSVLTTGNVTYASGTGVSADIPISTLSASGNYIIFISPVGATPGSMTVKVTNP